MKSVLLQEVIDEIEDTICDEAAEAEAEEPALNATAAPMESVHNLHAAVEDPAQVTTAVEQL